MYAERKWPRYLNKVENIEMIPMARGVSCTTLVSNTVNSNPQRRKDVVDSDTPNAGRTHVLRIRDPRKP